MKNILRAVAGNFLGIMVGLWVAAPAFAVGAELHSSIDVKTAREKDGKLTFTFKVVPGDKMVINNDGPWKLDIKKSEGITFSTTTLPKAEMKESIPGFTLTSAAPPAAKSGKVEYQMVAFVCTKDKTLCYRDVHKTTASW